MKIYLYNRKRVEILERFTHSILIKIVKTGNIRSVAPDSIRLWIPKVKPPKNGFTNNNNNNQLNLDL